MPPSRQLTPFPTAASRLPVAPLRTLWDRLSPLARDIVVILAVKAIVLGILWYAFFRAPAAPQMTMEPLQVEQMVLGPSPPPESPDALR